MIEHRKLHQDDDRVFQFVSRSLTFSLIATATSIALWLLDVGQLASWASVVPAVSLVTGLFAMVAALVFARRLPDKRLFVILLVAVVCCVWPLAIAVGL